MSLSMLKYSYGAKSFSVGHCDLLLRRTRVLYRNYVSTSVSCQIIMVSQWQEGYIGLSVSG